MTLPLFAECALPGCRYPSDESGGPCPSCTALFAGAHAWSIRRSPEGAAETSVQVADRKVEQRVAQAVALTRPDADPERRQNQHCWLCEARRTCTKQRYGWECDTCRAGPS